MVETTNFHPQQDLRAATKHVLFTSEDLKVTERFTRVAQDQIRYEFAMEDADLYADVWRGELPLRRTDAQIYEYACHEGNYALPGILAGARLEESEGSANDLVATIAGWLAD